MRLGYTEPRPQEDPGLDAARKPILARELGLHVELDQAQAEPLVPTEFPQLTADSFLQSLPKPDEHRNNK